MLTGDLNELSRSIEKKKGIIKVILWEITDLKILLIEMVSLTKDIKDFHMV